MRGPQTRMLAIFPSYSCASLRVLKGLILREMRPVDSNER